MTVTTRTYEEIALAEPERQWELHHGALREKPGMSAGHNHLLDELDGSLRDGLDRAEFRVSVNAARLRATDDVQYVPDLVVIPAALREALRDQWRRLEVHDAPMPLVVEVWSPSTGTYNVDTKIPAYQARGDKEIWRVHPFERTLTRWLRLPDGSYERSVQMSGTVRPVALPGVALDLDALFA
ncbi:MAG: Uma2 family endonuclease [Chloroflexota bacterium]|nr:Uma2 family endonuclease [Chloroflexota bacterium]